MSLYAKSVLLIDDSSTVRRMLEWSLKSLDLKFLHASDGLEGLDLLDHHDVHLVVVDLNMPRMDGIEFIRNVRGSSRRRTLPIILLTTEARESDREMAYAAGANLFMTKPSTPALLRINAESMLKLEDPASAEARENPQ